MAFAEAVALVIVPTVLLQLPLTGNVIAPAQSSLGGVAGGAYVIQIVKPPLVGVVSKLPPAEYTLTKYVVPAVNEEAANVVLPQAIETSAAQVPEKSCKRGLMILEPRPLNEIVALSVGVVKVYHSSYTSGPVQGAITGEETVAA